MIVGLKDAVKLFGISIVACCAVFVCTLFINYNIDLASIETEISGEAAVVIYQAQVSMGKVTVAVTGGCLAVTSAIMLLFYVKNFIDAHGKELGILKALGYSDFKIAKSFWVFGSSVLVGCALGFIIAFIYLPDFYRAQNAEGLFPELAVAFHPVLAFLLIAVPTVFFTLLAVLYADLKLKNPVLDLLCERRRTLKTKAVKEDDKPFLKGLSHSTLRSRKTLVFLVAFSAFCFSAMVQMSLSMNDLSSETFAWMILMIGLILAFVTLFLSLSSIVKGNAKTIAMMRVFGYGDSVCSHAVLGAYRPVSYLGFAIGTGYQYGLLKLVMTFVFADIEAVPEYHFDAEAFLIALVAFLVVYELVMYFYSSRIRKLSLKSVMAE